MEEGKLLVIISRVNIAKPIAVILVGHGHSFIHSAAVGCILMVIGVLIAKHFGHSGDLTSAVLGDVVGYSLHGIGLVPFIEAILKLGE